MPLSVHVHSMLRSFCLISCPRGASFRNGSGSSLRNKHRKVIDVCGSSKGSALQHPRGDTCCPGSDETWQPGGRNFHSTNSNSSAKAKDPGQVHHSWHANFGRHRGDFRIERDRDRSVPASWILVDVDVHGSRSTHWRGHVIPLFQAEDGETVTSAAGPYCGSCSKLCCFQLLHHLSQLTVASVVARFPFTTHCYKLCSTTSSLAQKA